MLEAALAAETLVLAALAVAWALSRRTANVIQDSDYVDGLPRTFIRAEVRHRGDATGAYLADARTGRALQFVGVEASQVQLRLGPRTDVVVGLKGVPLVRDET